MRESSIGRGVYLLAIVVLVASLLVGCQATPARSARASADWSRGVRVGTAHLNAPVAMAVEEEGRGARLLWVAEGDQDQQVLHYARLDASGRVVAEARLDVASVRPHQPGLVLDAGGALHATWLGRDGDTYRLYHALLDDGGQPIANPEVVSLPGTPVHSYAGIASPDGGIDLFCGAIEGDTPGLYQAHIAGDGSIASPSRPTGVMGFDPSAVRARDGSLHLVWKAIPDSGRQSINYGVYDAASGTIVGAHELAAFSVPTGLVSHRPALGIAQGQAYVFWSLERRGGGLTPPSAESSYVSFPLGNPEAAAAPRDVLIPEDNHPIYRRVSTAYRIGDLAQSEEERPSTFVYLPAAAAGEQDQLATVFAVQISGRTKSIVQVALALWADSAIVGYQIVGQTESISLRPGIEADVEGDLHLNWIDTAGFGQYAVYYAATTEEARNRLNRLGMDDVAAAVLGVVWGLAQAASFAPIALLWLFPPLVVLALYAFIRAEDGLDRRGPRVMLVVGALLYTLSKFLFRPGWLAALPLPRGTPQGLANALIYLVPVIIPAIAALLTLLYIRRREYSSLLPAFAVFVVSDALLTLLVYVPGMLAE